MTIGQYFSGLFGGIKSLATGMGVTIRELFTPKITQQYPENRATLVIPERVRGELIMPHDENNEHACTACGICQMNCPNGTIKVISEMVEQEDGKKKKVLKSHNYDLGMCTFCNLCVITCPTGAIEFSNEFENAIFNRSKLNMVLNAEGSKLREKKATPKPAEPAAEKKVVPAKETPKAEDAKVAEAPAKETEAKAIEDKREDKTEDKE